MVEVREVVGEELVGGRLFELLVAHFGAILETFFCERHQLCSWHQIH